MGAASRVRAQSRVIMNQAMKQAVNPVGKRLLTVFGVVVGLVFLTLLLVPLLLGGRVAAGIRVAVNRSVDATVDWRAASLSLLRDFPNLTLRLEELAITGAGLFEGDTLAAVQDLRLVLDLGTVARSLFGDDAVVVRAVELDRPVVLLRVLEDGTANWRITGAEPEAADAGRSFAVALRRLDVRGGRLVLDNREAGLYAELDGLAQSLSGDFSRDRFTLRSSTRADATTLRFTNVPWLAGVTLGIDADIDADMAAGRFVLRDGGVRLNELALALAGSVTRVDDDVELDLTLDSPATGFRHILSLVPAVYARDFEGVDAAGTVEVGGRVHGRYGPAAFPAFSFHARVQDGMFRYPDLPLPARDIALDLTAENPGGHADSTVIDVRRLSIEIGGEPITGTFALRTPLSDPDVDFRLHGRIDLADVRRTVKLDGVDELTGVITSDVTVRTRMSWLDRGEYDRVAASGTFGVAGVTMSGGELPHDVAVDELTLRFTPRHVEVPAFRGTIGSSDVQLAGRLDNLIGFALRGDVLRGTATLASRSFDLDEWRSPDSELAVVPVPGGVDFTVDADVARLVFDGIEMRNARGTLRIADRRATFDNIRLETLGGAVAMNGWYETTDVERPLFDLALTIEEMDIPAAFTQLETVKRFAPVAQYAEGSFSADVRLNGALGSDMLPEFEVLNGRGSLLTSTVQLRDFPALEHLADALRLDRLRDPAMTGIRSTVAIRDGRLHVEPFHAGLGDARMRVSGSNGIDHSLDYTLALEVPREWLGGEADRAVSGLIAQAGRAGIELSASDVVELGVRITGTVRDPAVAPSFSGIASSVREGLQDAAGRMVEQRADDAAQRVDEIREEARRRAAAQADSIVAEAESRAETIRAEARELAERVRTEGNQQADALLERATTPVARAAARPAADRLRREADERADRIVQEADRRADEMVAGARRRADALRAGTDGAAGDTMPPK